MSTSVKKFTNAVKNVRLGKSIYGGGKNVCLGKSFTEADIYEAFASKNQIS